MSRDDESLTVGERVTVYCADQDQWYNGTVERVHENGRRFYVRYKAEDAEWIDATNNFWRRSMDSEDPEEIQDFKRRKRESVEKLRVGSRVSVWWPMEKQYSTGTLKTILPLVNEDTDKHQPHQIDYDDGDSIWTNLLHCKFDRLDFSVDDLTIGSRISVHHKLEGCKIPATIIEIRLEKEEDNQYHVEYDDQSKGKEWLDLNIVPFECIDSTDESVSTADHIVDQQYTNKRKLEENTDPPEDEHEQCEEICGICISPAERPRALPCHHIFCRRCIRSHFSVDRNNYKASCPICDKTIRKKLVRYDPEHVSFRAVDALKKSTGKVATTFSTASAASMESPGMVATKIIKACSDQRGKREYRGYFWRFHGDDFDAESVVSKCRSTTSSKSTRSKGKKAKKNQYHSSVAQKRQVEQLCMKTGKVLGVYDSITEAASSVGITSGGVSKCCNFTSGAKTAGGFKWRFAGQNGK